MVVVGEHGRIELVNLRTEAMFGYSRVELIAYYERRGFVRTGERRPFPVAVVPPLGMVVLEKAIA